MVKFIKNYFGIKSPMKIIIFILCDICVMVFDVIIAYTSGQFVDLIVGETVIELLLSYCIKIIICYILTIITSYVYQILSNRLREEYCFNVSAKIIAHIHKVPITILKKFDASYLTQRIYKDSADVVGFVLDNIVNSFVNVFVFLFLMGYILNINFKIAIVFMAFLPIYCVVYITTQKGLIMKTRGVKEKQNIYYQRLYEQVAMVEGIKMEASFDENALFLNKTFSDYIKKLMKFTRFSAGIKSVETLISYMFYAILLVFGAIEISNGNLTLGGFTIINAYFNKAINVINYYLGLGKGIQQTKVSYERILELINWNEDVNGISKLTDIQEIAVKNLSFKYPDSNKYILKDLSHIFKRGNIYLIRGENGIGKSTFINIIIGLLKIKGSVFINGKDIEDIDMYGVRKVKMAIMRQKVEFLFESIGKLVEIKEKDVLKDESFRRLFFNSNYNINNFKEAFPNELSGGEIQKIYMYKVLQKNADVMIMDEPTSAFDEISKNTFLKIVHKMKKNKIIIIVSHENDFANIADEIIDL